MKSITVLLSIIPAITLAQPTTDFIQLIPDQNAQRALNGIAHVNKFVRQTYGSKLPVMQQKYANLRVKTIYDRKCILASVFACSL